MSVKVASDQEVLREAAQILLDHMTPASAARFWAIWQAGEGDYLAIREKLFGTETVDSLYEKISAFQPKTSGDTSS
jgi:hypothetical protein